MKQEFHRLCAMAMTFYRIMYNLFHNGIIKPCHQRDLMWPYYIHVVMLFFISIIHFPNFYFCLIWIQC